MVENIGENLCDFWSKKRFLRYDTKSIIHKRTNLMIGVEVKNCFVEGTVAHLWCPFFLDFPTYEK